MGKWLLSNGTMQKVFFMLLIIVLGCNSDNKFEVPSRHDYFPLRVGDYRIYQVSETQIQPINVETALNYEVKTLVTDSFKNAEGLYSYIISHFKRANANETWIGLDTWVARSNEREVVITESNKPYVRLSYPVESNRSWNGNEYNNEQAGQFCPNDFLSPEDAYKYGSTQATFNTPGGLSLDNTVEVVENDNPDIFTREDIRKSVYALNLGLVFRSVSIKKYCTEVNCYNKQLVECGRIITMELKGYGRE